MVSDRFLVFRTQLMLGTPIHNTLKDMYGLFRFLEMPVFSVYKEFRENFEKGGQRSGALRMQIILRGLMLRRKKDDKINGRSLIVLPEKVFLRYPLLIVDN
jgi:SNF2 family DNA or RNA helicase